MSYCSIYYRVHNHFAIGGRITHFILMYHPHLPKLRTFFLVHVKMKTLFLLGDLNFKCKVLVLSEVFVQIEFFCLCNDKEILLRGGQL